MKQLSVGQRKIVAEIIGNIAVAWFSAGIISPLFLQPKTLVETFPSLTMGLLMSIFFSLGSLFLMKGVKS